MSTDLEVLKTLIASRHASVHEIVRTKSMSRNSILTHSIRYVESTYWVIIITLSFCRSADMNHVEYRKRARLCSAHLKRKATIPTKTKSSQRKKLWRRRGKRKRKRNENEADKSDALHHSCEHFHYTSFSTAFDVMLTSVALDYLIVIYTPFIWRYQSHCSHCCIRRVCVWNRHTYSLILTKFPTYFIGLELLHGPS